MLNCTYKHMHAHCKVVQYSDTRPADEVISVYVYACVHMNLDGCPEEAVRSLEMESRWLWNQTPVLSKRSRALNSGAIFQVLVFVCVSQVFWLVWSRAVVFQKYSFYLGLQIVGCPKTHYYIFILFFFPENLCFRYTVQCGSLGLSLRFLDFAFPYLPALVSLGEMGEVQIILWLTRL